MGLGISIATISAVASIACYAATLIVAQGHFIPKGRVPTGTIIIVLSGLLSIALFLWCVWTAPRDTLLPLVFYAASFAMFHWTIVTTRARAFLPAFTDVVPASLSTDGPYRFVRHPFYVSYLLYYIGNAVATLSWIPWAALLAMLALYVIAARNEERYLAQGSYAQAYQVYKRTTGMFFPRLFTKQ